MLCNVPEPLFPLHDSQEVFEMFALLSHRKRARSAVPRRARLWLERLEARDVPATLNLHAIPGMGATVILSGNLQEDSGMSMPYQTIEFTGVVNGCTITDGGGVYFASFQASGYGTITASAVNATATARFNYTKTPPSITSFQAIEHQGDIYSFEGTVSYDKPFSNLTIRFSGMPDSIQNKSTTVDDTGHFALWLRLNGTSSDNGAVFAQAVDTVWWNLSSNTVEADVYQTGT
jgi:hypothetical protein